jgi:hypothetical protein
MATHLQTKDLLTYKPKKPSWKHINKIHTNAKSNLHKNIENLQLAF